MGVSSGQRLAVKQARTGVRWYRAYRVFGRAPVAVEEVARFVQRHKLTDTVVSLRVERGASREFLLFLALETEQWGVLPEEIEELLGDCRCLLQPYDDAYSLEQIQGMASGDLQVRALGQCLEYRRVVREAHEDPFELEGRVLMPDAALPDGAAERLLWFLSAAGSGSWGAFRSACAALGIDDAGLAVRLSRQLRLLGHLEVQRGGGRWRVTPPAVVEVECRGQPLRYLTGARDAQSAPGGRREVQPGGPDRLVVPEGEEAALVSPGEALAAALPDGRGFAAQLEILGSVNPQRLNVRRFGGLRFETEAFTGQEGLYELALPDNRTQHALYLNGSWRSGEFYTLRFLALQAAGLLGAWRYASATQELAIRYEERLPELYERALVLCSGLLPENRGGWLVYANVPSTVVTQLSGSLNTGLDVVDAVQA
jgi:hypothetical protein